jgi:hypothetical protein
MNWGDVNGMRNGAANAVLRWLGKRRGIRPQTQLAIGPVSHDTWGISLPAIRDFTSLLQELWGGVSLTSTFAAQLSQLLDVDGSAVFEADGLEEPRLVCADGTWEGREVRRLLSEVRCDWALTAGKNLIAARLAHGRPRAIHGGPSGVAASALVMPLSVGPDDPAGALFLTLDRRRALSPVICALAECVASCVALGLSYRRVSEVSHAQAERIARLVDDIERMGVFLKRRVDEEADPRLRGDGPEV